MARCYVLRNYRATKNIIFNLYLLRCLMKCHVFFFNEAITSFTKRKFEFEVHNVSL